MSKNEIIYAAGLFDGEGSVMLNANGKKLRAPRVALTSTSYELVTFMQQTFGGYIFSKKVYSAKHSPSWEWRLDNNKALDFLSQIVPYLREKRKIARATLLLDRYKLVTVRNGHYSKEQLDIKNQFETEFFTI